MLPALLLALREGVEAALVLGIGLSVLRKLDRPELARALWSGATSAALVSILFAILLNILDAEFQGTSEQIFEGVTMLLAAGMLTWLILWVNRQSGDQRHTLERNIQQAVAGRGRLALFLVAFLAVVREGVELALFLLAARLTADPLSMVVGASIGLGAAGLFGWFIFAGSYRLSLGTFFKVTNWMLLLFAAGLVGLAVGEFNEAGLIPELVGHIWNLGPVLPDDAGFGQILRALFGYTASPSLSAALAYGVYLVGLAALVFRPLEKEVARRA
jgi:high-affinity iron transporter